MRRAARAVWAGVTSVPRDLTEQREQALALVAEGVPKREVCRRLGIYRGTLYRWCNPDASAAQSRKAAGASACPTCGGGKARHARQCRACMNFDRRLPPAIREQIHQRVEEGHDYFTIALAVGLSPRQVGSYVNNMRKRANR